MRNKLVFTQEQRNEHRKLAEENKAIKVEWANNNLRNNYLDRPLWAKLASKIGMQLPVWYHPATDNKYIRRFIKKTGKTPQDYNELIGFDYRDIGELNPDMPAYAAVGLFLECADEEKWI